jgi:hypothetical protein
MVVVPDHNHISTPLIQLYHELLSYQIYIHLFDSFFPILKLTISCLTEQLQHKLFFSPTPKTNNSDLIHLHPHNCDYLPIWLIF